MLPSLHQFNCWCISFGLPSCPLELDVDPLLIALFYNMVTVGKHFCPLWCFRVFPWTVNACVQAQTDFLSTWGEEQLAWWPTSSALWLAQMWFVNGDGLRKLAHSLALLQAPCGVLCMAHRYLHCLRAPGTLGFLWHVVSNHFYQ